MDPASLPRVNLAIPSRQPRPGRAVRLLTRAAGSALAPVGWALAHRLRLPGLRFQADCARLGVRLLFRRKSPIALKWIAHLLFSPIVLTRYFEFDFAWGSLAGRPVKRYLDVSSPFMFPLLFADRHPTLKADFVNPDKADLPTTRALVNAAGLNARCALHEALIEEAGLEPASYDAVTCLSVLEHIPDDRAAVARMWSLVRPGGVLVLTVPCAARAHRLFTNLDHYGLLGEGEDGFTFLEYVYDDAQLAERVFAVTGAPARREIWGEQRAGFLRDELARRWAGGPWRFWSEPLLMARAFKQYDAIADLPGEGVASFAFVKP